MTFISSLKQYTYLLLSIIMTFYLASIGRSILVPLVFALIFSIFLYPIDKKLQRFISPKWLSILVSFLAVAVPVLLVILLFSLQFVDIVATLPSITKTLKSGGEQLISFIQDYLPFLNLQSKDSSTSVGDMMDGPLSILTTGLTSTTTIVANTFLVFIYSFFLLLYRQNFKKFIIYQTKKSLRTDVREMLSDIKETVQGYVSGLGLVILFLSVINSLGLWIIGIDYPLFWGTLGGLLAIIPYIGSALGGLLPFLYSLASTDTTWQPIAILVFYGVVQAFEGNILTPKVVGNKVNINPLFAIISLLFFGSLWGIGGVILALPTISILRIILEKFESTHALSLLLSNELTHKIHDFSLPEDHSTSENKSTEEEK